MFFVKATYRGETRKLTFPAYFTFPPFDDLCEQLCRVFPLSNGFTISRLLFSPKSENPIRLLIGQKVQVAEDYIRHIEPYKKRLWPDAMLRLTVLDGGLLESPATKRKSYWSQPSHSPDASSATTVQATIPGYTISSACVPPPPILFPSYSATAAPIPTVVPLRSQTSSFVPNSSGASCCSVDASKKDIQALINNFMRDLNGVISSTFPAQNAETSLDPPCGEKVDMRSCTKCKRDVGKPFYYCIQCGADVCGDCFGTVASPNCSAKAGHHRLGRRAFVSNFTLQTPTSQTDSVPQPIPDSDVEMRSNNNPTSRASRRRTSQVCLRRPSGSNSRVQPAVHNAVCNLCDSGIRGVRYKCLVCPDFDACEGCFTITNEQHPNHSFVRISNPADYIHRQEHRFQHRAVCDVCNNIIFGTRYKCLHPDCPDYDLCENCESHPIPQHPETHPKLKLKSVDMSVDVIQSRITEQVTISGAAEPLPGNTSEHDIVKPSDPVTHSVRNDPSDWRSAFLTPEWHVSNAVSASLSLNSPILNETCIALPKPEGSIKGSETVNTVESAPSEISEIRLTPTAMNKAMLVSHSGDDAVTEASPAVSTPASLLGKSLEKEWDSVTSFGATHAEDVAGPSFLTLPPGAEFVKIWLVRNTGSAEWPDTTELVFTGGDAMTQDRSQPIGAVKPGSEVEISLQLLKAPSLPGNYLSCWSLRTQESGTFGDSLWVNVTVADQSESSTECLSSSSIIKMPQSVSQGSAHEMFDDEAPSPTDTLSDMGSGAANVSIDGSDWQDFATEPAEQEEYVMLYEDSSSSDEL